MHAICFIAFFPQQLPLLSLDKQMNRLAQGCMLLLFMLDQRCHQAEDVTLHPYFSTALGLLPQEPRKAERLNNWKRKHNQVQNFLYLLHEKEQHRPVLHLTGTDVYTNI